MEYPTYASRLQFLGAHDVDDAVVDYDGLSVVDPDDDKIGSVEGFIVDAQACRVYYLVVDSGGWFRSRRFLLPIGHATLDSARKALQVDVRKGALSGYPEFHPDRFREFSDADLRVFESRMTEACCPGEAVEDVSVPTWAYDTRRHYTQPGWWTGEKSKERLRPVPLPSDRQPDDADLVPASAPRGAGSPDAGAYPQPGAVQGLAPEERPYIGDIAEDERQRRFAAERAREDNEPRQSER